MAPNSSVATIKTLSHCSLDEFHAHIKNANEPLVFKSLVKDWPLVEKAKKSEQAVIDYLLEFDAKVPVKAFTADKTAAGRFFYNNDLTGLNFEQVTTTLEDLLNQVKETFNESLPPTKYMGSTTLDYCLPGLAKNNQLSLEAESPLTSIWIGNQTQVAAHYDVPENVACVAAGERQFTLFPPEQIKNLYIGPMDMTPAGQQISLVDFKNPDFKQYPKFKDALKNSSTAYLSPGDAIYIPSLWWHHVEATNNLNVLINYWWRKEPAYLGLPNDALLLALLTIRQLPENQRQQWRTIFDHYLFDTPDESVAHIPEGKRGILGDMDEQNARKLKAMLLNRLNR